MSDRARRDDLERLQAHVRELRDREARGVDEPALIAEYEATLRELAEARQETDSAQRRAAREVERSRRLLAEAVERSLVDTRPASEWRLNRLEYGLLLSLDAGRGLGAFLGTTLAASLIALIHFWVPTELVEVPLGAAAVATLLNAWAGWRRGALERPDRT